MEKSIQTQIDTLNDKVDLILEYVNQQRLKSQSVDDLISDVSIIGKDMYDSAVTELDNRSIELDPEDIKMIALKVIRNVRNINGVLDTFESTADFLKDASPIMNEMIIDLIKKLNEFDQKGYFEFLSEAGNIIDNVVTHFSREDIRLLADNVVPMLETVKSLTQPEMLKSVNNAVKIFSRIEMEAVPEYSIWKLMREMNKPEMKRAIGFMVSFMKNMSKPENDNQ
ncbi:MAG: hypothetical protein DRI97_00670 [Bacteroidetes bacterium]|nr:MAG: hypothetical protein DRI97_00670 [Bacteroidota bacterium]RLD82770.1 MAG: hypothetical protein DRJ15_00575 [Bacteroidota bacterium]